MAEVAKTYLEKGRMWTHQTHEARNSFLTRVDTILLFNPDCTCIDQQFRWINACLF